MKNLKKVLALALAFALSLSLFAGAAQFTDAAEINTEYADSVNMLVELGIVGGYPDGSFGPAKNITRAEMTKLVYALKYGPDASEGAIFAGNASKFTDVEAKGASYWAKGFINYCATTGIVGGIGNGKFNPDGNVTVAEAAKMLLVALGADAAKENYAGTNWMGNVVSDAIDLGVFGEWKGNPAAAATREVIAYLMGNTLFSPIYVYSPVTGMGSQLDINNKKNINLAEKVFDLTAYEGIVVATDNLAISYDENGQLIDAAKAYKPNTSAVDAAIVNGVYSADGNKTTVSVASENECTILVEYVDDNGVLVKELVDVGTDADDALLGCKVNVYIKTTNGKKLVVGDLIVDSDTVVYDVAAGDITVYPNKDSKSTKNIAPYISILADGKEIKVKSRQSEVAAVPANTDYAADLFADYFYFASAYASLGNNQFSDKDTVFGAYANGALKRPALSTDNKTGTQHEFMKDLGKASCANYRVISVDGGASVSYIIRTAEPELKRVGAISEAAGTISLGGAAISLEDVVMPEGIKKGDMVLAWYEGTTLYLDAVEKVTGMATILDKDTISVNDKEYVVDTTIFNLGAGVDNISQYFIANNNNNDGTTFTVYGDYVLDIDGEGISANIDEYAVVIDSSFDADEAVAKVRLAFANETTGVYTINRVDNKEIESKGTGYNVPNVYKNDAAVGLVFRYKLSSDGTVNLYSSDNGNIVNRNNLGANAAISNYNFYDNGTKYATADDAVVYLLYGGLTGSDKADQLSYDAVKAAVYKISDLDNNQTHVKLELYNGAGDSQNITNYGYVLNSGVTKNVVVAAYSVGASKPTITPKTGGFAYVLDAEYKYNYDTSNYYATFTLIGEDGLITANTAEEIDTDLGDTAKVGAVPYDRIGSSQGEFKRGTIANARVSGDKITAIEILANLSTLATPLTASTTNGFFYATIANVGSRSITLYPYSAVANDTANASPAAIPFNIVENTNNFVQFAIDGDVFVEDGEIETITKNETIPAKGFNAIVHIDNGAIAKVISLHNNY